MTAWVDAADGVRITRRIQYAMSNTLLVLNRGHIDAAVDVPSDLVAAAFFAQ